MQSSGKDTSLTRAVAELPAHLRKNKWCPRPDLNRNTRFRKPLLDPVELRGQTIVSERLMSFIRIAKSDFFYHFST